MENKQDLIVKHFEANTSMEAAQLREIHALKKKHQVEHFQFQVF